jgi:hypothetical protein
MTDKEKIVLVAQETSKVSSLLQGKYMELVENHSLEFAASAVVGACITSIAIILNTVEKESRDTAIKAVHEQIDQQFKMFEKSLDDFVGEAKQ